MNPSKFKTVALKRQIPRWAVPLLNSHINGLLVRVRAAFGGRGSGKSHEFAEKIILRCATQKTRVVCLREIQKSIKFSVKQLLEDKIIKYNLGGLFDVQRDQIIGKNGSLIIFQGLQNHTADSIKSLEDFDIAWVEEAQTISQFSLDILRPTIRKQGSELWFTWNPRKEDDPIEVYLRHDTPENAIVIRVNYGDNPWFPDPLKAEMDYDRSRDQERYEHIWLGEYEKFGEARIFKNWVVEEFEAEKGTIFRLGADWGYSIDPTVAIRTFIVGKRLYVDYECYEIGCDVDLIPDLFAQIPDSHLYPMIADSSRPETIAFVRKNGYPRIYSSVKGKGSIMDGIEWLKSFDIIVHPRCVHAIDELRNCKYKIDKDTGKITGVPEDKKNHVIDALRYSCEASRKKAKEKPDVRKYIKPIRNHWNGK